MSKVSHILDRLRSEGMRATLLRGGAGAFLLNVGWAGLGFSSQVVLARLMGKEGYGDYAFAFSWVLILTYLATCGFERTVLRFLSVYRSKEQWGLFRGLTRFSHRTTLAASSAVAVVIGISTYAFVNDDPDLSRTLYAAAVVLPVLAIATLRQGIVQAMKRPVLAQYPLMTVRPASLMIAAVTIWFMHDRSLAGQGGMIAYLIANGIALGLVSISYRTTLPAEVRTAEDARETSEWVNLAVPLLIIAALTMLMRQGAIIIIGMRLGTDESGLFAAAARLVDLVLFGLIAVNVIAAPMIAELHANKKMAELQRLLLLAAWASFTVCVPVAGVMFIWGRFALSLFGPEYVDAYPALLILLVGQSFNALCGPVGYVMTMTGQQRAATIIVVASTTFQLLVCWFAVPYYGLIGAAWGVSGGIIIWNFSMIAYVFWVYRLNTTVLPWSIVK